MKFLKLYLFKFSRWLKYLFFCGLFFLIGNNVFAIETFNFDSYSNNYQINNVSGWTTSSNICKVSNSYFSSSPNSLMSKYDWELPYCRYKSPNQITSATFSINDINYYYGGGQLVFFDDLNKIDARFLIDQFYPDHKIKFSLNHAIALDLGDISNNTWHNVFIEFNSDNIRVRLDLNDWKTISTTTDAIIDNMWFFSESSNISDTGLFLDDLSITSTPPYFDDIIFINPINSSIQSLNDFYWEYNLKIATSTYWATYDFLNVDLTFVHYTGTTPDATTTLSVLREPMNTYVPNTYYNNQIIDINSFPTQLGSYNAVIGLKGVYSNGTTDLLAYDTVTFGIATTTPINPTAWCSGLCNDIATATDWIGQIGNGVNCAFRSATCYLFSPHQYNLDQFNTQYNNFKLVFPFNTFFDLASTTQNAFASSTINNNQTVGLPNIRKTGTTTEYYIQPLLSSSTMASFIGSSNATLFRNTINYLLYGLTAGAIFLIIW